MLRGRSSSIFAVAVGVVVLSVLTAGCGDDDTDTGEKADGSTSAACEVAQRFAQADRAVLELAAKSAASRQPAEQAWTAAVTELATALPSAGGRKAAAELQSAQPGVEDPDHPWTDAQREAKETLGLELQTECGVTLTG